MVSGLKAELLAVTALGFVAVFAIYMIFITMTGPVTYRFSLFHLLTVQSALHRLICHHDRTVGLVNLFGRVGQPCSEANP